jgi:hypothetical protein
VYEDVDYGRISKIIILKKPENIKTEHNLIIVIVENAPIKKREKDMKTMGEIK